MRNNLEAVKKTIYSLKAMTDLDGIDYDIEGGYTPENAHMLVELTEWAEDEGLIVTAAPYTEMKWWTDLLAKTNAGGKAGFSWWNLQLYGGTSYAPWLKTLKDKVPDPEAFLIPGWKVSADAGPAIVKSPAALTSAIDALRKTLPIGTLDGAFIWKYENMQLVGCTADEFAQALTTGLE
jgi:hypothetical protein